MSVSKNVGLGQRVKPSRLTTRAGSHKEVISGRMPHGRAIMKKVIGTAVLVRVRSYEN
jgi:transcription elongation GreA/GreB family factor